MNDITTIDDFSSGKTPEQLESLRQITLAVYVLYALCLLYTSPSPRDS